MNKKFIYIPLYALLVGLALVHTTPAYAAEPTNPFSSLIDKIVQRFGLKAEDVQTVFNQHRDQRQADMQKRFEERLSQLITEGKITEAQKQLIVNKHKELQAARQSDVANKNSQTPEERRSTMQKHKEELEAWAKQNGIDLQYLLGGRGIGHFGGHKGGWMMK